MADDFLAATGTTGALSVGGAVTGNIETQGDRDWFRINVAAGTRYLFELAGLDGGGGTLADPFLGVFDSSGTKLLQFNDNSGNGLGSALVFTQNESGIYFLAAAGGGGGTGTYRINAAVIGVPPATDDFAGSSATVGAISAGGAVNGSIQFPGDSDWFRISLSAGTHYQIDVEGVDTSQGTLADPFLRLFRGNDDYIGFSDDDGGSGRNPLLTFGPAAAGDYYIEVISGGAGSYRLSANSISVPPITDDFSPSTFTIGTLARTGGIQGILGGASFSSQISGNIETLGDSDWFRISLTAGTPYEFVLERTGSSGAALANPVLRLLDRNGFFTGVADSGFVFVPRENSVYYLDVSSSGVGTYELFAREKSLAEAMAAEALGDIKVFFGGSVSRPPVPESLSLILSQNQNPTSPTEAFEIITGTSGLDTHTLRNFPRNDFTFTSASGTTTYTDKTPGRNGVATLVNIERVQFNDGFMAFDTTPADNAGKGYLLYRAAFDRTPDADGLGYWIRELDRDQDYGAVVAASFIASPEFIAKYGTSTSNTQFIELIYENVLDRAPDQEGGDYWLGQLESGYARSNMLASFAVSQENYNSVRPLIMDGILYV